MGWGRAMAIQLNKYCSMPALRQHCAQHQERGKKHQPRAGPPEACSLVGKHKIKPQLQMTCKSRSMIEEAQVASCPRDPKGLCGCEGCSGRGKHEVGLWEHREWAIHWAGGKMQVSVESQSQDQKKGLYVEIMGRPWRRESTGTASPLGVNYFALKKGG